MNNHQEIVATFIAPHNAIINSEVIQKCIQHLQNCGGYDFKTIVRRNYQSVDVLLKGLEPFSAHKGVSTIIDQQHIDLIVQYNRKRHKKILIADMESTIIKQEMLDELAAIVGMKDKVSEITRRAMNGELDFSNALKSRAHLLSGLPISTLEEASRIMTLTPGAESLLHKMKSAGSMTWLVSGGFNYFVKIIAQQLGFDQFYANNLEVQHNIITGHVSEPILDKNEKLRLTQMAISTYGSSMDSVLTLGDGANDIPMLKAAEEGGGLGIAYHAKPLVRESIRNQINYCDLTALLDAQGLC